MPATLTLKNIPDAVYEHLKRSAEAHGRSMNSEAIVCLEAALLLGKVVPAQRLAPAGNCAPLCPKLSFERVTSMR